MIWVNTTFFLVMLGWSIFAPVVAFAIGWTCWQPRRQTRVHRLEMRK